MHKLVTMTEKNESEIDRYEFEPKRQTYVENKEDIEKQRPRATFAKKEAIVSIKDLPAILRIEDKD